MAETPESPALASVTISARREPDGRIAVGAVVRDVRDQVAYAGVLTTLEAFPPVASAGAGVAPHTRFQQYLDEARSSPPMRTAVVHPCSDEAIAAAIEARDEGLLEPVLVGPEHKIRQAAEAAGVSLDGIEIETVEHSHAAADRAVALATAGRVAALMKGSLHTDELLGAVVAAGSGLRTQRRISHVYVLDTPSYPKPLIIIDAAINIAPNLEHKRDIV